MLDILARVAVVCLFAAGCEGPPTPPAASPAAAESERTAISQGPPASEEALAEALRACAGAGDRAAALQVRIAAPAAGRTDALVAASQDSQRPMAERRCALLGLRIWPTAGGTDAFDPLTALAMETPEEDLAGDAADALAARNTPAAVRALVAVASRDEIKVRRRAVLALALMQGEAAGPAVEALRTLAGEGAPRVVEAALRGLAARGSANDVELFRAHAGDADPLVRQRAVEGLAQQGDASVIADLTAALADRYPPIAVAAARGLGSRRSAAKEAVPALGAYLDGPERGAADAAMGALGAIGDPDALRHITPFLYDRDGYLRVSAAKALAAIGDPAALPHLDRALDTELINARVAVLGAIASFGEAASRLLPKIQRLARQPDLPRPVAEAADKALRAM